MKKHQKTETTNERDTKDMGKVRLGGMAPAFATPQDDRKTADPGKVRLGGMAPTF